MKMKSLYRLVGAVLALFLLGGWYLYRRGVEYAKSTFGETAAALVPWYTNLYFGVAALMAGAKP